MEDPRNYVFIDRGRRLPSQEPAVMCYVCISARVCVYGSLHKCILYLQGPRSSLEGSRPVGQVDKHILLLVHGVGTAGERQTCLEFTLNKIVSTNSARFIFSLLCFSDLFC